MRQFISLNDLGTDQIQALFESAHALEREPVNNKLSGKVITLVFMNPSLRTSASFQAGIGQMGGTAVMISPGSGSWTLEHRDGARMDGDKVEHIREAIPVLAGYSDALGVRSFAAREDLQTDLHDVLMRKLAGLSDKPFFNMESASDHPCQALADWKTLDDLQIPRGGKFVLSWAYHPKPLPYAVPNAALSMARLRGMDVTILCPPGYELPNHIAQDAKVSHDRAEALNGAHVLYCKSWGKLSLYGKSDADEAKEREKFRDWCVAEDWFQTAQPDAKFMHCLPVRRNVKVADDVLDGPRSVVQRQANNRLHVQKAMLLQLLGMNQ